MAIGITWGTKVINVPKLDMVQLQPPPNEVRQLDVNVFRLALKDLEDSPEGMVFDRTHNHNTQVNLGGVLFARTVEIINGYTVTFEDGQYAVALTGANNNIADVMNLNQVSLRSNNSAGLVAAAGPEIVSDVWSFSLSGVAAQDRMVSANVGIDNTIDLLINNAVIANNPNGTRTVTIYEDDGMTIRAQVEISADRLTRTRIV